MHDGLLIVVIGGMGTIYGAVIGSVLSVYNVPTGVVGRLREASARQRLPLQT